MESYIKIKIDDKNIVHIIKSEFPTSYETYHVLHENKYECMNKMITMSLNTIMEKYGEYIKKIKERESM